MEEAPPFDCEIVARLAGAPVTETETPRDHGRSRVARFALDSHPARSVVAKRLLEPSSYANEVASLRLLDGTGVAPGFRGADGPTLTFLMEDVGDPPSTADAYQHGTESDATAAFLATATALARMHAATFGRESEWLAGRPPGPPPPRFPRNESLGIDEFVRALHAIGCEAHDSALAEMRMVEAHLAEPGPWLSLTHGDPCPDNILLVHGRAVIIDFEFAWFRHALLDAVHPRMIFPTCWCANRVPPGMLVAFEERHRAGVIQACPTAADDREWERNLGYACAGRLVSSIGWLLPRALDANGEWGLATTRQRFVPRLRAFLEAPSVSREFPALTGLAERAITCLRSRWTDEENTLPVFAPFR